MGIVPLVIFHVIAVLAGVLVVFGMISFHRKMRRAARQAKEHFDAFVERSPIPILVHENGIIRYANRAAVRLCGIDQERSMEGLRINALLPTLPTDHKKRDGRADLGEHAVRDKGGRERIIRITAAPVRYREDAEMELLELTDITDLKAYEKEVGTRENEFRLLAMSLPIGIFKMNLCNELTYVNTRFLELLAIPFEENFEIDWTSFVEPDDRDRLLGALDETKLRFRETVTELGIRAADGTRHRVILRLSAAISDEEIHFIGVVDEHERPLEELTLSPGALLKTPPPPPFAWTTETVVAERPRILLVEDNAVNQKVARKMLERHGIAVDLAVNGVEAIEHCRTHRYALILMDCQMPIVDGYEATRQIRALAPEWRAVPIIAMTANAMRGDRERCVEAGMNDYLAKPVTMEALDLVLLRHGILAGKTTESERHPSSERSAPLFETTVIAAASEGDRRFEREMLDLFLADTRGRLAILNELVAAKGDPSKIRIEAHTIKGSCANIGAQAMRLTASRIEQASLSGGFSELPSLVEHLSEEMTRTEELIEKYRRTVLSGLLPEED